MLPIVLAAALIGQAAQAKPLTKAEDEAAVAARRVSSECADAAEKAWRIGGYDKPEKKAGETRLYSHSSHYNRELKRCLIKITSTTLYTEEGTTSSSEEVWDAIEQKPIGSLFTAKNKVVLLNKGTPDGGFQMIENTPTNMAWFRDLMNK
jgi:hypothetical protein